MKSFQMTEAKTVASAYTCQGPTACDGHYLQNSQSVEWSGHNKATSCRIFTAITRIYQLQDFNSLTPLL